MSKAKATSVPQLGNHSQYSSHVGALNLIDESKSLPLRQIKGEIGKIK